MKLAHLFLLVINFTKNKMERRKKLKQLILSYLLLMMNESSNKEGKMDELLDKIEEIYGK